MEKRPFLASSPLHLGDLRVKNVKSRQKRRHLLLRFDCPPNGTSVPRHPRDLLRTTGQKGLTKRILHRYGAWELLPRPPTEAERLEGVLEVSHEALKIEQKRLAQHLKRFEMDTRSPSLLDAKFKKNRIQWFNLPPYSAG